MRPKITETVQSYLLILYFLLMLNSKLNAQNTTISGYLPDHNTFVEISVKDGLIDRINNIDPGKKKEMKIYVAPGLIDTQVNGYASVSFNREDLTREKIEELTKAMWREGVTTFFPTIITNPTELIRGNLEILTRAVETNPKLSNSIPGYFLEGPYISPIDGFRGAHAKEWVRLPDWEEFSGFYEAAEGKIIQVGVAPEVNGAMEFIKKCRDLGIGISLAHHNATADQVEEAVNLGAHVSTHLGNGCANTIHRHDNPIWPQLSNDLLTPSIIADGHHLRKEELRVFFKVKGSENLMLVSDATELAGMPAGNYNWNGKEVVMTEDGMLKYPAQNVLAGASFPVRTGVKNMMGMAGCTLEESLRMATATPAKVYRLNDRGILREGLRADLILFMIEEGEIIIQQTILAGEVVYQRNK
jgi:N-acetylglucosamine-6-phosphate deacetylase